MNNVSPEQMLNTIKQSQVAMVEMAARSIECMEKHLELNLKAAKANLADATEASSQLMGVKDFPELYSVAQTVGHPAVGKAASYNRNIYNINAEAATEFAKLVESRIEEANKAMASSVNELSRNAPAGTEGMVAMMKSAFAASNSAFDAINKATRQVVEMVETNVEAASKASEAAVSGVSPKKASRRAAE